MSFLRVVPIRVASLSLRLYASTSANISRCHLISTTFCTACCASTFHTHFLVGHGAPQSTRATPHVSRQPSRNRLPYAVIKFSALPIPQDSTDDTTRRRGLLHRHGYPRLSPFSTVNRHFSSLKPLRTPPALRHFVHLSLRASARAATMYHNALRPFESVPWTTQRDIDASDFLTCKPTKPSCLPVPTQNSDLLSSTALTLSN